MPESNRANVMTRAGELRGEGINPSEALTQAWEETQEIGSDFELIEAEPKRRRKTMSKNPVAKMGDDISSQLVTYGGMALLVYGAWIGYIYWRTKKLTLTPWKQLPPSNIAGRRLQLANGGQPPWYDEESQTYVNAAPDVAPPPMPRGAERVAMLLP